MMKKNFFFRVACTVCVAAAAILQLLAILLSHDAGTHYFERGAVLPILSIVFALLGALCGTLTALLTDRTELNAFPFSREISVSLAALGFIAVAISLVLVEASTLAKATAILMLLSALYEILLGHPKTQRSSATALLGLVGIIGMILLNAVYYFDARVEMNAPLKVTVQVGLLFAMLARTSELRYLIGKPQPRMLLILSAWAASIGAISALSLPTAFLLARMGRLDLAISDRLLLLYAAGGFLTLCTVITALLRIHSLFKKPVPEISSEDGTILPTDDSNGKDLT